MKEIPSRLSEELGLKVYRVVQGIGNIEYRACCAKFFKNSEKVSEITGVDVRLILD